MPDQLLLTTTAVYSIIKSINVYGFIMAWHKRYINSISNGGLRLTVEFVRRDLLWISPAPVTNPNTGEIMSLPIRLSESVAVSPNVLDLLIRETREVLEQIEVTNWDGSKEIITTPIEKLVWHLRSPKDFFPQTQSQQAEEHPLHKGLTTGGTVIGKTGDFMAITKRSSVSINALVYRLAVGMTGSELAATQYIGAIAADAWERDNERAVKLYNLIVQSKAGYVLDEKVSKHLKASASVGQTVESAVLRSACIWLGIDPDAPLHRQQGRPRSRSSDKDGNTISAGKVIELTLQSDGSVTGRLLTSFIGLAENTILATLTLVKLVSLLVALRDAQLVDDADLLEAYLEAIDPDWQAKIADEIGVEDNNSTSATNPWSILGLSPGASLEEVKRAYRKIMRHVHPDTSGLPQWYAQTVNDAYRKLLEELDDE